MIVAMVVAERNAKAWTKVALRLPCFACDRVHVTMGSVSSTLGSCAPSGCDRVWWATGSGTGPAAPGAEGAPRTGTTLGTGAGGVLAGRGATLGVGVGVGGAIGAEAGRLWLRVLRRVGKGVGNRCGAVGAVGGGAHRRKASRRCSMALSWALWYVVGSSWSTEVS